MIPWLLVAALMSGSRKSLSQLVDERIQAFPCSGELNFRVDDVKAVIARVVDAYASQDAECDTTDGVSLAFDAWRFNLRGSNTEPLLRLNIETRRDEKLLQEKTDELIALITQSAE